MGAAAEAVQASAEPLLPTSREPISPSISVADAPSLGPRHSLTGLTTRGSQVFVPPLPEAVRDLLVVGNAAVGIGLRFLSSFVVRSPPPLW